MKPKYNYISVKGILILQYRTVHSIKICSLFQVVAARKKYAKIGTNSDKSDKSDKSGVRNIRGVVNFTVDQPVGEDERTVEKHISRLKEQFHLHPLKRKPDAVEVGMRQTMFGRIFTKMSHN